MIDPKQLLALHRAARPHLAALGLESPGRSPLAVLAWEYLQGRPGADDRLAEKAGALLAYKPGPAAGWFLAPGEPDPEGLAAELAAAAGPAAAGKLLAERLDAAMDATYPGYDPRNW